MIEILLILSVYQKSIQIASKKYYYLHDTMSYGFKKGSKVFLDFKNITTHFIFGFATQKEIKQIKSYDYDLEYCDGSKKLSKIQFFITENTAINFLIPLKTILTPYSISCELAYDFLLDINIINGKNHLDYRLQDMTSSVLSFAIIYILIFLIFLFIVIFLKKYKISKFHILVKLLIFTLIAGIQEFILYSDYLNMKDQEYYTYNHSRDYYNVIYFVQIGALSFLDIIILAFMNSKVKGYALSYLSAIILTASIVICMIIILILFQIIKKYDYKSYFAASFFYILGICIYAFSPILFSLTKIGFLLYLCSGYFTFGTRIALLGIIDYSNPTGILMMQINIMEFVFNTVYIICILLDYFWFYDQYLNTDVILSNKPEKLTDNFTNDMQRMQTILFIKDEEN